MLQILSISTHCTRASRARRGAGLGKVKGSRSALSDDRATPLCSKFFQSLRIVHERPEHAARRVSGRSRVREAPCRMTGQLPYAPNPLFSHAVSERPEHAARRVSGRSRVYAPGMIPARGPQRPATSAQRVPCRFAKRPVG